MLRKTLAFPKPDSFIYKFLWCVHPLRALGEAWLVGAFILLALSRVAEAVAAPVLTNGLLFTCGTCGMWVTLRARVPESTLLRQVLWELGLSLLVSLLMVAGLLLPAHWLGQDHLWLASTFRSMHFTAFIMALTGVGTFIARGGARLWLVWERLRRQRMVWALTHTHLTVILVIVISASVVLFSLSVFANTNAPANVAGNVFVASVEQFLHTVFPALTVVVVFLGLMLIGVLPPSLLVSFLIARRTTRRLENLAEATRALREGDYATRVTVTGEDEVAQVQDTFNAMAEDLERTLRDLQTERDRVTRLLQSRRELIASVSHELRTPVATVRGYLESLQNQSDAPLSPSVQRDLDVIAREVARLQRLIEDLFTLSQTEAGGLVLRMTTVNVADLVRRRVEAFAPLAWQRERVEVVAEVPADLPPVQVDAGRLDQVLVNLLRNALRHTPPGGIVAVTASADATTVCLDIRDTGEGIPPEALPHIWERFYRGATARAHDARGAGLGLALVKELAQAMHGSVRVESTVGQGTCFSVALPRADTRDIPPPS